MNAVAADLHERLAEAFKAACLAEIAALKPGNVHIFADGHGMAAQDFALSAEAASRVIALPELGVGERILAAVEATWDAVGCNTNLGIVLLCAPLIHAMQHGAGNCLRERLQRVLRSLTIADAEQAYRAILRASPAGLGESRQYDVHEPAKATLLEAMREAEKRDRIAWQYSHDYADVFNSGVLRYRQMLARWERPAWAATAVYLDYLAAFPDTHVARKHGGEIALAVQHEAAYHARVMHEMEHPKHYQRELLKYDADLKARGINPGTSADLTVATLLAAALEDMLGARPEAGAARL